MHGNAQMQKWQALIEAEDPPNEEEETDLDKQLYQAYQKGSDHYQAGDYEAAVQAWTEALDLNPVDQHALWQRGAAKEHMSDRDGAIDDYSESLRIDSGSSQSGVFFSRASARSENGDEEGAIADWSEVVRLEPGWTEAWCCRGTARLGLGDPQGAALDADEALRIDRDSVGAWGLRGAAKQMLEDHVGAAADCRKALQLDPSLTWVSATLERSREAAPDETAEEILPEEPIPLPERDVPTEPMPSVERLKELIYGVYERKNPEKLSDLDVLFQKYAGKEMIMYQFICKKYGEEAMRFEDPKGPSPAKTTSRSKVEHAVEDEREQGGPKGMLREELPHRERGNRFFKAGKFLRAISEYEESVAAAEDGWILALSNRAICHLKLKEYKEAVSIADRCLEQDGAQEVPLKVHLTKFKALAESDEWIEAFSTLRKLRARGELSAEVEAAALQEERARRRQQAERVADELSSSDEEEDEVFGGDNAVVSRNLARAVKLATPQDFAAKAICLVGAFGEKPDLFKDALVECLPDALSAECVVQSVTRDGACKALESQSPDLVVLCRPDLSGILEDWAPVMQHLMKADIVTVVTGFCDASLVENEDILKAFGCTITSPTMSCFGGLHSDPHPHHHVLAFKGGSCSEGLDLQTLKQGLIDRGFNIPALTGLD